MKGTFIQGDFLQTKACNLHKLIPGDVVVFRDMREKDKNSHIIHRIISVDGDSLVTKGDNVKYIDAFPVTIGNLIGRVDKLERKGNLHKVRGGLKGLYLARTKYFFRWFVFRLYKKMTSFSIISFFVKLLLKNTSKKIIKVKINTDEKEVTKWILNRNVIARKGPGENNFYVKKPFDLIIKDSTQK